MKKKQENIWNIHNSLTLLRIIITFITVYFIFAAYSYSYIIAGFVLGMITDFLDGQIARRWKLETEFGRKFDVIADRFLLLSIVLAIILDFGIRGLLDKWYGLQIFLIMSREIIAFPFAIMAWSAGQPLPHARFIGKLTTFLQGFAFPLILLNIHYPSFQFSIYLTITTCVIGIISGFTYIRDVTSRAGIKK